MRGIALYWAVVGGGFRRYATYRIATVAGLFTNTVFGFILTSTYTALWSERPALGGYERAEALTFVWVVQGLLTVVAVFGGGFHEELQERIRNGDVAVDLYRPVDLQAWWLAADLGRAALQLLPRGAVPLVVGALAFDLALPVSPVRWALFLSAVVLAVLVSFAIRYLVALASFWLLDGAGLNMVSVVLAIFFSGMVLPLPVFPGAFGEFVRWLPWSAMLQVPADVLMGRDAAGGLAFQVGWAVVLLLAGRAVQGAATRKVVVQGG